MLHSNSSMLGFGFGFIALLVKTAAALSASDIDPDIPVAQLISSATSALAQGKAQDALVYFDVATTRDPQNYMTYFRRGAAYLSLGRSAQAGQDFDRVLAIKPSFEGALVQRAKLRSRQGDWASAKADYTTANKKNSQEWKDLEEAQGAEKLSSDAEKAQDWAACTAHADVAINVAATARTLRQRRAKCRFEKGDLHSGVSDLLHVAQLTSSPDTYQQISATYFYALDETDSGLTQIKHCLHSDPDSKACSKLLKREKAIDRRRKKVTAFIEKSHYSQAVKLLVGAGDETGLLQDTKEETAQLMRDGLLPAKAVNQLYRNLVETACQCYNEMNQLTKGQPYCDEALTYNSESLPGLLNKAQRQLASDLFEECLRTLKTAADAHGSNQQINDLNQKAQTLLKRSKQKDYYKVLGVSRDADAREIKRAWRKMSVKFHPDKAHQQGIDKDEAQKKMAAINEAHEVLADPELKARFDRGDDPNDTSRQGGNPFQGSPFGQGGHQQFFQQGAGGQQFKFHFQGGFPGF